MDYLNTLVLYFVLTCLFATPAEAYFGAGSAFALVLGEFACVAAM